jgi:hypothetical protein
MNLRSLINREFFRGLSFQVCFAILALGLVGGPTADAGIIVNINQVGADVVLSVSGSFTRPGSPTTQNYVDPTRILGGSTSGFSFSDSSQTFDEYTITTGGGSAWGSAFPPRISSPTSSNLTGINRMTMSVGPGLSFATFAVASDYVDNTPINGTMTFTGTTLSALGITNTGTFSYTTAGSTSSDTIVVNIGTAAAAVPEPASLILLSSIGLVGSYRCYRRKSRRLVNVAVQQS